MSNTVSKLLMLSVFGIIVGVGGFYGWQTWQEKQASEEFSATAVVENSVAVMPFNLQGEAAEGDFVLQFGRFHQVLAANLGQSSQWIPVESDRVDTILDRQPKAYLLLQNEKNSLEMSNASSSENQSAASHSSLDTPYTSADAAAVQNQSANYDASHLKMSSEIQHQIIELSQNYLSSQYLLFGEINGFQRITGRAASENKMSKRAVKLKAFVQLRIVDAQTGTYATSMNLPVNYIADDQASAESSIEAFMQAAAQQVVAALDRYSINTEQTDAGNENYAREDYADENFQNASSTESNIQMQETLVRLALFPKLKDGIQFKETAALDLLVNSYLEAAFKNSGFYDVIERNPTLQQWLLAEQTAIDLKNNIVPDFPRGSAADLDYVVVPLIHEIIFTEAKSETISLVNDIKQNKNSPAQMIARGFLKVVDVQDQTIVVSVPFTSKIDNTEDNQQSIMALAEELSQNIFSLTVPAIHPIQVEGFNRSLVQLNIKSGMGVKLGDELVVDKLSQTQSAEPAARIRIVDTSASGHLLGEQLSETPIEPGDRLARINVAAVELHKKDLQKEQKPTRPQLAW